MGCTAAHTQSVAASLRTGDLGHVDADGNVVIVDRLKELLKVKGFQVAPAEVEAALTAHPDVADAGVVSRTGDRAGEIAVAFVVPHPGVATIDTSALHDWLRTRLAPYKQPATITVVDHLPRSPAGKLLRRTLSTL